jgi:hypothetical protein
MEHVIREDSVPLIRDEHAVDALQDRMSPLVTPSKKSFVKVDLLKCGVIEESTELPHVTSIQPVIVLILNATY